MIDQLASPRAAWRLNPNAIGFTLLLAALGTLPPFSIDMALPAMSQIGDSLQSPMGTVMLTLSFFMAGVSVAQLMFGPVSDRLPRMPPMARSTLCPKLPGWPAPRWDLFRWPGPVWPRRWLRS